jgi:hypothetical protein
MSFPRFHRLLIPMALFCMGFTTASLACMFFLDMNVSQNHASIEKAYVLNGVFTGCTCIFISMCMLYVEYRVNTSEPIDSDTTSANCYNTERRLDRVGSYISGRDRSKSPDSTTRNSRSRSNSRSRRIVTSRRTSYPLKARAVDNTCTIDSTATASEHTPEINTLHDDQPPSTDTHL